MGKQNQWVVGINAVRALLAHDPTHVREVLISTEGRNARVAALQSDALRYDVLVRIVSTQALEGIAGALRHQGVAARYHAAPTLNEEALVPLIAQASGAALFLVLDGVQDPHNVGACLRSACGAGATAVIIPKDNACGINATVRKTSAGAAERVPVITVTNLARCLRQLRRQNVWVYGLSQQAQAPIYRHDLSGHIALVLGGEAQGMRRLTQEQCDACLQIPMVGELDSFNVSVAAGISLYEVRRQRLMSIEAVSLGSR